MSMKVLKLWHLFFVLPHKFYGCIVYTNWLKISQKKKWVYKWDSNFIYLIFLLSSVMLSMFAYTPEVLKHGLRLSLEFMMMHKVIKN